MISPEDFYSNPTEETPALQLREWHSGDTIEMHAVHVAKRSSKKFLIVMTFLLFLLLPVPYVFATGMLFVTPMRSPIVGVALVHPTFSPTPPQKVTHHKLPLHKAGIAPNAPQQVVHIIIKEKKFPLPPYLLRPTQQYGTHGEQGEDFDAAYHSNAIALWSGTVMVAERTCWNTDCSSTSGGVVIIKANVPKYGVQSMYYLHLDSIIVRVNQHVNRGNILGLTGGQKTGGQWPTSPEFTTGPHIEVGSCATFLVCPFGYNFNPAQAIQRVIINWNTQ